jgi:uncharacterized integral membrane protein
MRLFKLFTTAMMLGLIGLFFYENASVFRTDVSFNLDLYIREQVTWTHPLYVVLLLAVLLGFLAGVGVMLKPFLQMRRMLGQERQAKESALAAGRVPALPPAEEKSEDRSEPGGDAIEQVPKQ